MPIWKIIDLTLWESVGQAMPSHCKTFSFFKFVIAFLSRKRYSSSTMAAIIICSEFRATREEICHCFCLFRFSFPQSGGTRFHDLTLCNIEDSIVLFNKCFPIENWELLFYCNFGFHSVFRIRNYSLSFSDLSNSLYIILLVVNFLVQAFVLCFCEAWVKYW